MANPIAVGFARFFFEKRYNENTYEQIISKLREDGATITERIQAADSANKRNHSLITHIIGIERWGQTRLREILGGEAGEAEYDSYRPPRNTKWAELSPLFEATRQETIALTEALAEANVGADRKVAHDTYGALSAAAWLRYLNIHARLESRKLR
ncbi:MAG: hypothetical protein EA396_09025 [Anaerolineaceae bacterium]|nr:MAG: hypothetical protein EA396_09025 [Anaerolineaceae bacterium]